MLDISIRTLLPKEYPILTDLLYEAIFQLPDATPYSKDIIYIPEIYAYIKEFGKPDDLCLVAEFENKIIGGVWCRIMDKEINDFGYIDLYTPELVISLFKTYRNQGIGTLLMKSMLILLKEKGHKQISLKVETLNYAVHLYKKLGFKIIEEQEPDYLMLLKL